MGFKYITTAPLLTSHDFFMSLVVEYLFRVDSSPFYQCSSCKVGCDFGVLK